MATRYYLTHRHPDDQFFANFESGRWDLALNSTRYWGYNQTAHLMTQTKVGGGTSISRFQATINTLNGTVYSNYDVCLDRFISPRLDAQTISGTFDLGVASEASDPGGITPYWRIHIWLARYNPTTTVWDNVGDLLDHTELTTAYLERRGLTAPAALVSTAVTAGDRLVIDIGFRLDGTVSSTGYHAALWTGTYSSASPAPAGTIAADSVVGDPSDFATTANWFEFSGTITELADWSAPSNGECATPEIIPPAVASLPFIGGPYRGSEATSRHNTLWWRWTPDVDADVVLSVFGSTGEVILNVKSAEFTPVVCDPSNAAFGVTGGTIVASCSSRIWLGLAMAQDGWHAKAGVEYVIIIQTGSGQTGSTGAQATQRGSVAYIQLRERATAQVGDILLNAQNTVMIRDGEIVNSGDAGYGNTPTGSAVDLSLRTIDADTMSGFDASERLYMALFGFELIEIVDLATLSEELAYIDIRFDPAALNVPANAHGASVLFNYDGDLLEGYFGDGYTFIGGAASNPATRYVRKINPVLTGYSPLIPAAEILDEYQVAPDVEGSDYLELSKDQTTLFYTSAGRKIKRYDLNTKTQLPDFADLPVESGPRPGLRGMRLLPPGDGTGGLLVADGINVKRLDASGNVIQTYTPTETHFAQDLDKVEISPGGAHFHVSDQLSTTLFKFNIATGAQEGTYRLHQPAGQLCGFDQYGGYRAASFAPDSDGIPDPTLDPDYVPPEPGGAGSPPVNNTVPCCGCDCEHGGTPGEVLGEPTTGPLPEWTTRCGGGGVYPAAVPVTHSEDWRVMSPPKVPDLWLGIDVAPYPSGSIETTSISTKPMVKPSRIEGRVRPGSLNFSDRALSDWKGNPEAATLSLEVNDADGVIRAITEALGVSAFAKAETSLKLLSEAGRAASLDPRVIQRGVLSRAPVPLPGRKARIEMVDRIGSERFQLDPAATLQKQFVTREHLEPAGIINTPKASLGKPFAIVLGEHSDHGALNVNNTSAEKGLLPVLDLGDLILTDTGTIDTVNTNITVIPPPVLSYEIVGTPGTREGHYAVTMITATGETLRSNIVDVTDAPDTLDISNYVRLTWVPPAGWEDVYASLATAYRVCGRTAADPNRYLDIMNNGSTFVDPETEYHDGEQNGHTDVDIEKEPGPPAVSTATIVTTIPGDPQTITTSEVWGVMCWALGYSEMHELFGSNGADGGAPGRTRLNVDDPNLMTPLSANWPHPDPWVEVNGVRLSLFYVKGVWLQQHRDGAVSFAVNACGMTDTGDDTGDPITEANVGYAWVLNELALKNGGEGYKTGAFWPHETYSDGTQILDIAALDAFQAITVGRIGGRGYQMHLALTEPITIQQFRQWFNTTFSCYDGQNDDGQYGVWAIDDAADPSAAPIYRQNQELLSTLPEPIIAEDEIENRLRFHYDWDPDAQAWRGDLEMVQDITSQALNGIRDAVKGDGFLELRCTRDRTTARDAMAVRLFHNKVAPIYQPIPLNLIGLEQRIGTLLRLTHTDGIGVNGYVNRPFFVVRKRIGLNGPNQGVVLVARDVYRVYALGSGVMGVGTAAELPFVLQ